MTVCLCPMCTPNPAPTYTDEWRQECLSRWVDNKAREICALPSRGLRQAKIESLPAKLQERVRLSVLEQWGRT